MQGAFKEGFFHGDPHYGNVFVDRSSSPPKVTFIDTGGSGSLSENTRVSYLNFLVSLNKVVERTSVRPAADLNTLANSSEVNKVIDHWKNLCNQSHCTMDETLDSNLRQAIVGVNVNSDGAPIPTNKQGIDDRISMMIGHTVNASGDFQIQGEVNKFLKAYSIVEGNTKEMFDYEEAIFKDLNKYSVEDAVPDQVRGLKLDEFNRKIFTSDLRSAIVSALVKRKVEITKNKVSKIKPVTVAAGFLIGISAALHEELALTSKLSSSSCVFVNSMFTMCMTYNNLDSDAIKFARNNCLTIEDSKWHSYPCDPTHYDMSCVVDAQKTKATILLSVSHRYDPHKICRDIQEIRK